MSNEQTRRSTPSNEDSTAELIARVRQLEGSLKSMHDSMLTMQSMYQTVTARLALVEHRMLAMDYAPIPGNAPGSAGAGDGSAAAVTTMPPPSAASAVSKSPNALGKPVRDSSAAQRQLEEELQRLGLTAATSGFAAAAQNDPAALVFEQQQQQPHGGVPPQVAVGQPGLMPGPFMPNMMAATGANSPGMSSTPNAMMPTDVPFTGSPMTAQPPGLFPRPGVNPVAGAGPGGMPNAMFADPYFMAAAFAQQQQQQQQQSSPPNMALNGFNMMPNGGPMPMMMGGPMPAMGPGGTPNNNNSTSGNNNNPGVQNSGAGGGGAGGGNPAASVIVIDPSRASNEMLDRVCQQNQHQFVKDLCLKGCKAITNFTPLSRLRNLWKLNLQGCSQSVDDGVVKLIGTCNTRISRLNLCGCERVTDATPLAQLAYLFDLNLSGCQIGNASLLAISTGCGQLSRLAINSCPLVTSIACCGNLKELKLLYCRYSANITPGSISAVLSTIGQNLLTLNVDGVKFDGLELGHLPQGTALKNFNLKDNTDLVDLTWLTSVPEASRVFASLETLDMEGCDHLLRLGELSHLPALKTLRLSGTSIPLEELQRLARNTALHLHTLYVDGCAHLTDLSCLTAMRSLTKLVIDSATQGTSARALPAVVAGQLELVLAQPNHTTGSPTSAHGPNGRSPTAHGPPSASSPVGAGASGSGTLHPNVGANLAVGSGFYAGSGGGLGPHGYVTPNSISPFTSPTVFTVPPMPTIDQTGGH